MKKSFFLLSLVLVVTTMMAQHEQHTQNQEPQSQKKETEVKKSMPNHTHGKRVEYDLYINDTILTYVSKKYKTIAVNGSVPAPTLYFTEGDTAIIRVHNKLRKEETSIHWHGLLLPNEEDGVPYLTTAAIKAGGVHTFKFPLIQHGTYWYHSHTTLQEQIGLYGSIVIYPRGYQKENERVLMLSDWIEERPNYVLKSLKRASDWYAIRKNAVQSWGEALMQGYLGDRIKTEWNRMPAMDVSDVYYDKYLINGKQNSDYPEVKPGEKVRLRIINGGASTYFWVQFAGGKMKIVAADGLEVKPVEVDRLLVSIAETYDVEVTLPKDEMAYEFRATSIDIAGYGSIYLGEGMKMKALDLPKLNYFAMMREMNKMGSHSGMDMSGKDMTGMDHGNMKMDDKKPVDKNKSKKDVDKMQGMDHGNMKMNDAAKDSTTTPRGHEGMQMDNKKQPARTEEPKKSDDKMEGMDHTKMKMDNKKDADEKDAKVDGKKMEGMDHGNMKVDDKKISSQNDSTKTDENNMQGMDHDKMNHGDIKSDSAIIDSVVNDHESLAPANSEQDVKDGEVIFNYNMLRSPEPTVLDEKKSFREIPLTLTGNMIRYVWSFDNKTLSKSDKILIKKGENVRFILTNNTMMRHPLHLHGHFFRFVNKQGEYSPMKHSFDIQPMETVIIEFYASEEKDWFFHCHVLYHMMAGMARVVSYENSRPNEQVTEKDKMKLFHEDNMWWLWGVTKVATDGVFGEVNYSNNYNVVSSTYRVSYRDQYELQPDYQRFIDKRQFLALYAGADIRNTFKIKEGDTEKDRRVLVAGVRYLLPLFVLAEVRVDHLGNPRFQLTREDMPITRRLRLSMNVNSDIEYNIDFDYFVKKYLSIHASYDSEYKYGVGLTFLW